MLRAALVAVCIAAVPVSAPAADQCTFWIGLARQELQFQDSVQTTVYRARLRETSRMPNANGTNIELVPFGSIVQGTHDSVAGSANVSTGRGEVEMNSGFPAGHVVTDRSGRPSTYELQLHAPNDAQFTVTTTFGKGGVSTFDRPYQSIYIGRSPDPQEPRRIEGGAMHGDYVAQDGSVRTTRVSWNLKPVVAPCNRPPGVPDIPAEKKPRCSPPTAERALLDTTWKQREAKADELKDVYKELTDAYAAMQENQAAWRAAIPVCAIEEIGDKVAEEVLGDFGGEQAELTEVLGQIFTGDLSYLAQGEWENLGDAISNITSILSGAVGVGDPKAMEEQIADCRGLPADLEAGAKAFVDAYAEVKSLMPRVQSRVNDVHSLDQKYWDQWQMYYQHCLEYSECSSTPAADCPKPPDQPSGPMPGGQ